MTKRATPAVPVYFGPEGAELFGWYHAPAGAAAGPALVICPPIGFGMIMSHRALRHLAESAAAAGTPTLRFDYHGTGDSAGSDHDPGRLEAWLASVGLAIAEAKRLTGMHQVVLLGLRLGTLLASYAAASRSDVVAMVMWAPVASGRARVRELRASEKFASLEDSSPGGADAIDSEPVVAEGFVFLPETLERLGELDVECLPRAPVPQVLVVPRDDLPDDERFARAMERLGAVVTVAPFPGFDMMMRDPHSAELPVAAIRGMVDWLGGMRTGHDRVTGAFVPAAPAGVHEPGTARKEQPFFTDQGRLFGVLTRPAVPAGRPAIILANAGAIHRIGPNRLHVTLARAWTELGFPVLRLDLGGLGDSPPVPGMPENEPYSARAVADIGEAVAALRSAGEAQGIVVAGLCAGAHAAFHAARQLRGIVGVLLINPIVLYWTPSDALEVPPWMMQHRVKWYGKSAMRFASWGKLLRGHVDIFSAVETVSLWARDRTAAGVRALKGRVDLMASGQVGRDDVEQDLVSLCGRGVDVALLFSRGDPGFDNLGFSDASRLRRLTQLHNFAHYEVPLEGHTFATLPAQRMLVETLTSHLQQRFGKGQ